MTDVGYSQTLQDNINRFFPYLMEIRKRLLLVLFLFVITSITGFIYYERVTLFLLGLLNLKGINVVFTSPFQFFSLSVNSGVLIGLIVIFPLLLYQILSFLKPALKPKEYKLVLASIPLSILLFITGFAFGVWIMRYIVAIFYQKSLELQIGNVLDIELLLSKILLTSALMGLSFQFPIVMTGLMHLKIVSHKVLAAQRPLAHATSLIFVMMLPPTDIMSDVILVLPLVLLFELTLLLNRLFLKKEVK